MGPHVSLLGTGPRAHWTALYLQWEWLEQGPGSNTGQQFQGRGKQTNVVSAQGAVPGKALDSSRQGASQPGSGGPNAVPPEALGSREDCWAEEWLGLMEGGHQEARAMLGPEPGGTGR